MASYDTEKYRPGLGRDINHKKAHLYTIGEHAMDFQLPMCRRGWNRDGGEGWSTWRGNIGDKGLCKICERRASQGLDGVMPKGWKDDGEEADSTDSI